MSTALSFLLLHLISVISGTTMIIIWGLPSDLTLGSNYSATSWDDCVSACSSDLNCVFASTQGANCLLFEFGSQLIVTDSPYGSDNKVVFKTVNSTSMCPLNPGNSTFFGDVSNSSTPLTLRTYTVTSDNGQWVLVPNGKLKNALQ